MATKAKASKAGKKPAATDDDYSGEAGNFESLLSLTKDTIPEEVLTPTGTWTLKGKKVKAQEADEGSDILGRINFLFTPTSAHEDVDEDDVAAGEWKGVAIFHDVRLEKKSDLKNAEAIFAACGIDTDEGNVSDWIKAFNAEKPSVVATVGKRTYTKQDTGEVKAVTTLKNFTPVA